MLLHSKGADILDTHIVRVIVVERIAMEQIKQRARDYKDLPRGQARLTNPNVAGVVAQVNFDYQDTSSDT